MLLVIPVDLTALVVPQPVLNDRTVSLSITVNVSYKCTIIKFLPQHACILIGQYIMYKGIS